MKTACLPHGEIMAMGHYNHTHTLVEMTNSKQFLHQQENETVEARWHQRLFSLVLRRGPANEPDQRGMGGKALARKGSLPAKLPTQMTPGPGVNEANNAASAQDFSLTIQDCYESYVSRYRVDLSQHVHVVSDSNAMLSSSATGTPSPSVDVTAKPPSCGCALSLHKIFGDADSEMELAAFRRFLQEQHSAENLDFFMAVCYYHENPTHHAYQFVFKTFVHHNAANEVNLSETLRQDLNSRYGEWVVPRRCVFDLCSRHILHIMETDCYPRFLKDKLRATSTATGGSGTTEGVNPGSLLAPSQVQLLLEVPTPKSLQSWSASPAMVHTPNDTTPRFRNIATLRAMGRSKTTACVSSEGLGGE